MKEKKMENNREMHGEELRQADGLQKPGAYLTVWLVKEIAELTEKNPIYQEVQAMEWFQRDWGLADDGDDWINKKASEQGELPKGRGKQPAELEGNDE